MLSRPTGAEVFHDWQTERNRTLVRKHEPEGRRSTMQTSYDFAMLNDDVGFSSCTVSLFFFLVYKIEDNLSAESLIISRQLEVKKVAQNLLRLL